MPQQSRRQQIALLFDQALIGKMINRQLEPIEVAA